MPSRILQWSLTSAILAVPLVVSCSAPDDGGGEGDLPTGGVSGTSSPGGSTNGGVSGATNGGVSGATNGGVSGSVTGGASGATVGGSSGAGPGGAAGVSNGGAAGVTAGASGAAGAAGAVAGSGGAPTGGAGMGGAGMGGRGGAAGAGAGGRGGAAGGGTGGTGGTPPPLNCGGKGTVLENHGPPSNRVNYVIVADGYSEAQLAANGTLDTHLANYMTKRFSTVIGQPYLRYRNFVNICVIRTASSPICGSSTFGCCGSDSSRLATCNSGSVNSAITANFPTSTGFEVDWRAVVLNGSSWWNTGSALMLWSGGNQDGPGAAMHEGGHGFHQLADEYCTRTGSACGMNTCSGNGSSNNEVNSCGNCTTTDNKWTPWLGYDQAGATGVQGTFIGSRYVDSGQYRPSSNSMMNSLFGNNVNTSFNSVSREKIVLDIWRIISNPWDSVVPPAGAVTNPATLTLNLIDATVISVDWSVDGTVAMRNGGPTFNVAGANLSPGSHMIQARAYDNAGMDLVRQTTGTTFNRQYWATNAQKTVSWTVTIQ